MIFWIGVLVGALLIAAPCWIYVHEGRAPIRRRTEEVFDQMVFPPMSHREKPGACSTCGRPLDQPGCTASGAYHTMTVRGSNYPAPIPVARR